ncbi:hypothetical protein [Pinirhizobacter sp.]|jgi:hypothetical protein|uniref:hypothetical protein n=1 Tax=Pinirhizobacter sp. TaxID=2950432 RepID=UPI002F3E75D2
MRAVLGLCLFLASGGAMATAWPDPAVPEGTQSAQTASHLIFNGLDMRTRVFQSTQSADAIVDYYRRMWPGKAIVDTTPATRIIGHREGDYYVTIQVSGQGSGSKGTIGIVHLPDSATTPALGRGIPHPDNTVVSNDIVYPDDATPARTLAMSNGLSVQQNMNYFRDHLLADGWKTAQPAPCDADAQACVVDYENGDTHLALAVTRRGPDSEIVVNVMGNGAVP